MTRHVLVAFALAAVLALPAASSAQSDGVAPIAPIRADATPSLHEVSLALNWFPEAEHGGFYAAHVHSYYGSAGLEVEILPGGASGAVVPMVATGRVAFGICNADELLMARAQGAPVVAVMAPIQKSPRCIMVHKASGITGFDQLRDMTLAMAAQAPFAFWLRAKYDLAGVNIVPYNGTVAQFLLDPEFAQQGYIFSEPYVAEKKGGDPHSLLVADDGFNPYTSIMIANEKFVRDSPDVVRAMVQASVRGWTVYIDSPDETNRHINSLNPEMDLEILAYGAGVLEGLVREGDAKTAGIGAMTTERWQTLLDQLVELELVEAGSVEAQAAFTTEFLEAAPSAASTPTATPAAAPQEASAAAGTR